MPVMLDLPVLLQAEEAALLHCPISFAISGMHTAGLYPNNDVDLRKLKKLIQAQKLAPCFPGADSDTHDVSNWLACLRCRRIISEIQDGLCLLAAGGVPHLLPVLPSAQQGTVLLQKHLHRVLPASKSLPLLGHPAMRPSWSRAAALTGPVALCQALNQ